MGRTFRMNEPSVISEQMEEELVVVNLESGCYYNLNASATNIWMNLENGSTLEAVIDAQRSNDISKEEISQSIEEFCEFLKDENLLVELQKVDEEMECGMMDYYKPEIEKFTDMQEMLMLDPIHEVTEMGWPHEAEKV